MIYDTSIAMLKSVITNIINYLCIILVLLQIQNSIRYNTLV